MRSGRIGQVCSNDQSLQTLRVTDDPLKLAGAHRRNRRYFRQVRPVLSLLAGTRKLISSVDSNSYWIGEEIPCLTFGLRGVIHATIKVRELLI